jgi:hypothetical protein
MKTKEINARAKAFAADLAGPLGPKPLDKVMLSHIGFFTDLRNAGASWAQISELMDRYGIRKKDGSIMSPAQWMAIFSRATKREASSMPIVNNDQFLSKQKQPNFNSNTKNSIISKKEMPDIAYTEKYRDRTSIRATMKKALFVRTEE